MIASLLILTVPTALAWAVARLLGAACPHLKPTGSHIVWALVVSAGAVLVVPVVLLVVLLAPNLTPSR